MNEPTVQEIVDNIKEEMKECGWYNQLWSFLGSRDMKYIIEQLLEIKTTGGYICPHMYDLFRPYKECPFSKVRVVILTSLKSNEYGHHGIPLCQDILPVKALLMEGIGKDAKPLHWGKEGVLQLSTAMTSTINAQHHHDIWKPWLGYVINKINESYPDTIWVVIGKDAEKYTSHIKSPYKKGIRLWPSIKSYGAFEWINDILLEREQPPIQWIPEKKTRGVKVPG